VATFRPATACAVFCLLTLVAHPSATLVAAPQEPASAPPVSLERVREELERNPTGRLRLDAPLPRPLPTFRSRVDQRVFVPTLEEHLHKEFDLNVLQRQSAEWASKCCGYDLGQVMKIVDKAMRDRKIRKTREQIARELAELDAIRKD
jgi:hypothetical protein